MSHCQFNNCEEHSILFGFESKNKTFSLINSIIIDSVFFFHKENINLFNTNATKTYKQLNLVCGEKELTKSGRYYQQNSVEICR